MYIDYFKKDIQAIGNEINNAKTKKLESFKNNLLEGIAYYQNLLINVPDFKTIKKEMMSQFEYHKNELQAIEIPRLEIA